MQTPRQSILRPMAFLLLSITIGLTASTFVILSLDFMSNNTLSALSQKVGGDGVFSRAAPVLESSLLVASFAFGFVFAGAIVYRSHPGGFISKFRRFRWRMFFSAFVLISLCQGVSLALTVGLNAPAGPSAMFINWENAALFCALVLLFYIPGVIGEEIIFRGWINLAKPKSFYINIIYITVSAIIFSLAHIQWDATSLFVRFVSGIAYAWSVIRLGGIEFAFGGHLSKNIVLVWLIGPPGEHDWTGNDYELNVVAMVVTSLVFIAFVEFIVYQSLKTSSNSCDCG